MTISVVTPSLATPAVVTPVRPPMSAAALRRIARGFAADRGLIAQCPVDDRERTWVRLPTGPDVAAWLIRWPAGTSTGWHDHIGSDGGGVGGVFTVAEGELAESWWSGRSVVRRTLVRGALRSFGPNHVHDVSPVGARPALSVHVYSPMLVSMRSYRIDAGRELVLTGIGPLDEW
jgi:hypothetical protein